jgi:hypothetical protein
LSVPAARPATAILASLLAALSLAACGGGSATPSSAVSGLAGVSGKGSAVDAVAFVAHTPITKASYRHWFTVERALGASAGAGRRALGFLITAEWVLGEAAAAHISLSGA